MRYIQYASLWRHISPDGEYTDTSPELASYSCLGVVCEADSTNKVRRAASQSSVNVMQLCCITFTEAYRSGHNEAVLKTVWGQPHGGSNPSASAKQTPHYLV